MPVTSEVDKPFNDPILNGPQRVFAFIAHKLYDFGKMVDLVPISQITKSLEMSASHVRYCLDVLQNRKYIIGRYVCMKCGAKFTAWGSCPCCGNRKMKSIWREWELTPEGKNSAGHLGVYRSSIDEDVTLPQEAQSFLEMVSRILCVTNRNAELKFTKYLSLHWHEHSYTDWLLALATCSSQRDYLKTYNRIKPINTLSGLFDWAFSEVAKNRETNKKEGTYHSVLEAEVIGKERLSFALDMVDKLDNIPFEQAEKQYLYCLQIVDNLYSAFDMYTDLFNQMTTARGYLPRLLHRPKPAPEPSWKTDFQEYMLEMKKALKLA